ncbi:DNA replication and repair protein RecF [Ectothiorhodospiraceae bacterium BW-2]|nr:DNA replication and repair protein RecF [Ectothiorhodospiraceae bacterium BW-2]
MAQISSLYGCHFRSLKEFSLTPAATLNLIVGANGSGKSTLLESIELLTSGRSHLTRQLRHLVQQPQQQPLISRAELKESRQGRQQRLAVRVDPVQHYRLQIKLNQQFIYRSSTLAQHFPHLLIAPETLQLIDGPPELRRRFMDWLLFYLHSGYQQLYSDYRRALRQRNQLLKQRDTHQLRFHDAVWETLLAEKGEQIALLQQQVLEQVLQQCRKIVNHIELELPAAVATLRGEGVELEYQRGWPAGRELLEIMQQQQQHDLLRGFSSHGPHRADFKLRTVLATAAAATPARQEWRSVSEYCSRGEKKRLNILLLLAQLGLMIERIGAQPIVLVDDLFAELDRDNGEWLLQQLRLSGLQIFMTMTDSELARQLLQPQRGEKLFHVQQGTVSEVEVV